MPEGLLETVRVPDKTAEGQERNCGLAVYPGPLFSLASACALGYFPLITSTLMPAR